MPRNKLIDLNNLLFEQLERLSDEDLTPEELEKELQRTKGMCAIGKTIIDNAAIALEAQKHIDEYEINKQDRTDMLRITSGD